MTFKMSVFILALFGLVGCGAIDSSNSGVRTAMNQKVNLNEETAGFYTAWISTVDEWVGKEIKVSLDDMQPRAGDNLVMSELDVEIYYRAATNKHADLKVKYTNAHLVITTVDGIYTYPAYHLIKSRSRSGIYTAIGQMDSLTIHKEREALQSAIKINIQKVLDEGDPNTFTITKVIVKKANTDPSIEKAIQIAIQKDKELEAAEKEEAIKQAEARANVALSLSLTPNIMRMKELAAMVEACPNNTCIIDFTGGKGATPLIQIKQ